MNLAEDIYHAALSADVLLYLKDGQLAYKAPSGGVPETLRQRILQHKTDIAAFLLAEQAAIGAHSISLLPLIRVADRTNLPVSRAQQRVWFAHQQSEDGSHFNIQGCFAFDGTLDYASFEHAIGRLLQRHEVLRTTFFERDGNIAQAVQPLGAIPLSLVDLTSLAGDEQAATTRSLIAADLRQRFDLSQDTLLRVMLLRLSPQRHVAVFNMHHIASDGWTAGLLIKEFCRTYAAHVAGDFMEESSDPLQYADFAAWQEAYLQGDVLETGLSYWKSALDGVPQIHSLPIDKQRPAKQTFQGELYRTCVEGELGDRIRQYCQDRRVTLFMFLETALSVLLSLYGNQNDVVVGTPVAGRMLPESESLIGLFVNMVALRCQVDPAQSFDALLRRNKSNILSAFFYQHVPFEFVAAQLGHRRSQSYSPVFQIWFVLQNNEEVRFALPGCTVAEYTNLPPPAAKYELNVYASEVAGTIQLEWVFNSDVFDGRSIRYVAQEFVRLLQCFTDAPEAACHAHDIFAAQAAHPVQKPLPPLIRQVADTQSGLLERILAHATQHAHRPAVVTDEASYTYGELDRLSERYVSAIDLTGTSGQIGLLMERGVDVVAAMLAALKLGRAYVPLDTGYPKARLRYMAEHSQCDLIVCDASSRAFSESFASDIAVIDAPAPIAAHAVFAPKAQVHSPAYILYTSGSTGQPKGVFQSHAGLSYHAGSYAYALGLSHEDKLLQLASYSFDASVLDTYAALLVGASVHLADVKATTKESLLRLIDERGITIYHSTPTVFKYLFADAPVRAAAQIRSVVLGGEPIDPLTRQIFRRVFGVECQLIGLYGATESSLTTLGEITREQLDAQLPPGLGLPIHGTQLLVRRPDGSPTRIFESGELVIRSGYLANGYWHAPELTEAKFQSVHNGEREYCTGDAGYLRPDGEVCFVGRLDFQVKLNGIRIELGEIESVLHQLDDVVQAAALISHGGDGDSDASLIAYVASRSVSAEQDPSTRIECERRSVTQLRSHLKKWLPDYMVPGRFVFMDRLPHTPSGKVDRRLLLESLVPVSRMDPMAPRDELEQRLVDLWRQVLSVEFVGVQDDFFLLGGHSLRAMRLLASIEQTYGVAISMKDFFDKPSVEGCAERIRNDRQPTVSACFEMAAIEETLHKLSNANEEVEEGLI